MIPKKRSFRPGVEILEDRSVPATITVTTLADGIGVPGLTLREAILKSNATPTVADTIVFKAGLKGTIKLTSEIAITADVKINGPGADVIGISGRGTTRIFNIDDGNGVSSMTATIRKLTLTRGHSADDGGAIFNDNDDVILAQCTFSHNVADFYGGAYSDNQGRLTIARCRFIGNSANNDSSGGAVYSTGPLVVLNSHFGGNRAEYAGGAIIAYLANTSASIRGCTFKNNAALPGDGGAVTIVGGTSVIDRCTFAGNAAGGRGGGIFLDGGTAIITASTLSGNSAKQGGAILSGAFGELTLRNSTISGNAASQYGGGLYVHAAALTQTIQLSTIAFNTAQAGGGIFADRTIDLFGAIVARNSAAVIGHDLAGNDAADVFNASFCLIQSAAAAIVDPMGGSNVLVQDPRLGVLKANGGPTKTHALLKGSPAVNKGANTNPAEKFDQRGPTFKRVKGGRIDIGAFEC